MTERSLGFEMSVKRLTAEDITPEMKCIFCKGNDIQELKYGPLYFRDGITTHYFCMLFSAALSQAGMDHEGIMGFLPKDIQKEVRRGNRLKCFYCDEAGASIGCCNKKCRKAFHFPCGLENGANYQFLENFETYCKEHSKVQKISLKLEDWTCPVCMTSVSHSERPIQASCCKAAVFHKDCMQKVALNAGYFFKCPTCNASQGFTQEMRCLGIYVPLQDASWEREPNAYEELLYQYSTCDAETCECPKGREFVSEEGNWNLARCQTCGASAIHQKCGKLDENMVEEWTCKQCAEIEEKANLEKERIKKEHSLKQMLAAANGSTSDEDDDYFNLSDVKISDSCYSYFPYDKPDMKKFSLRKRPDIPDWRGLGLTVNLGRWIRLVHVPQPNVSCRRANNNPNPREDPDNLKSNNMRILLKDIVMKKLRSIKAGIMSSVTQAPISEDLSIQPSDNSHMEVDNESSDATAVNGDSLVCSEDTQKICTDNAFVGSAKGFIRDKRKLETTQHSPAKKRLIAETISYSGSQENDTNTVPSSPAKTDELCTPNNSSEKQMVVWKSHDLDTHKIGKTLTISKELEEIFNKMPSPSSLFLTYSSHVNSFPRQNELPDPTFNASQGFSGNQDQGSCLHVVDLNQNSSKKGYDETEPESAQASGFPRIDKDLFLPEENSASAIVSYSNKSTIASTTPKQISIQEAKEVIAKVLENIKAVDAKDDRQQGEINRYGVTRDKVDVLK